MVTPDVFLTIFPPFLIELHSRNSHDVEDQMARQWITLHVHPVKVVRTLGLHSALSITESVFSSSLARLRAPAKCSLDQRNPNEKPPPSERTVFYDHRDWVFFSYARPFLISRCDPLVYWRVSNKADFQICGEPKPQICTFILALAFNSFRNMGWLRN